MLFLLTSFRCERTGLVKIGSDDDICGESKARKFGSASAIGAGAFFLSVKTSAAHVLLIQSATTRRRRLLFSMGISGNQQVLSCELVRRGGLARRLVVLAILIIEAQANTTLLGDNIILPYYRGNTAAFECLLFAAGYPFRSGHRREYSLPAQNYTNLIERLRGAMRRQFGGGNLSSLCATHTAISVGGWKW